MAYRVPQKPFDPLMGYGGGPVAGAGSMVWGGDTGNGTFMGLPTSGGPSPWRGSSSGGGGGGASDAYYQSVAAAMAAQGSADAAQRRQNIQQSLIAFGMVPEGYQDKYGDVDDSTRGLIDKNTKTGISMYARLLDAKGQASKALLNRLGARGLFRSGAKGYGLRRGQLDFDRTLADSLAQLMQNIGGFNSSFANNELARQQQLAGALASSYSNYVPPTNPFRFANSPYSSVGARFVKSQGGLSGFQSLLGGGTVGGGRTSSSPTSGYGAGRAQ